MNKKRIMRLGAVIVASLMGVANLSAQTFGLWNFDSGNLVATVGTDLTANDGETTAGTSFGTTTAFGISTINGTPANVMKFPGSTNATMGFTLATPPANGSGANVELYTITFDVLYTATDDGKVRPFLQTDGGFITPAADFAINASGQIGSPGVGFGGSITTNTWYRVGFVVRTNEVRTYIDGAEIDVLNGALNRYPLFPNSTAEILGNRIAGTAGGGYFNSIQLRNEALNARQMRALGKASATGIPQVVPPVPSFVDHWIPSAAFANRSTPLGVVIDDGETTINLSSISLKYDGATLANAAISQVGDVITVQTNMGTIALGQHTMILTYTDSIVGVQSLTNTFTSVLFYEDFDGMTLGQNVQEATPDVIAKAFTKTPPAGWVLDDSGMPGLGNPDANGVDEWAGWSFASRAFWFAADTQNRELFEKAKGTVMIADPDEWDDNEGPGPIFDHAVGYFNSFVKTPAISLVGVPANSVFIKFDSSWRPEAEDDCGGTEWPACPATNNQTATIKVSYNGGAFVQKLKWDSVGASPTFHPDSENETVTLVIDNPVGATSVVIEFGLSNAGNDWWWAVDNLQVAAGPAITTQPVSSVRDAGASASMTVVAAGSGTVNYQWQFNGGSGSVYTNVPLATSATYNFTAETNTAGSYRVVVTDSVGTTTSSAATLTVIATPSIVLQPAAQTVNAGASVVFSTLARGRVPISYQWIKAGAPISGATSTDHAIRNVQAANVGQYACVISNSVGVITSRVVTLKVPSSITDDLVVHLKFDGDYTDSSGRGNNGTAVGAPTTAPGKIGSALLYTEPQGQPETNYVTLGIPADLHMTTNVPFSISLWYKLDPGNRAGDPAILGNKDWDSGGNQGFVLFNSGSGMRWNYRELDAAPDLNSRKDSGGTSPGIEDGNWHHCVVTFNRGGNAGIYVDGQLRNVTSLLNANPTLGGVYAPSTIDNDPSTPRTGWSTGVWNIGEDGSGAYGLHDNVGVTNAMIDDLGIWRRTLTPGEVLAIYTAGNAGNSLDTAAPVTDPTPLDPSIAILGTTIEVTKANTMLFSAPALTGPWTEVTGARGTNVFKEPAGGQKFYRGSQP
ncbi:MAG: hypothetical protein HOP33_06405 [Verrucomicrobia bacterium]|nr:hypothetical protein [Verrucomicrobiota bacterium]